jgi:large subunit ribosomal protein L21
MVAVIELAGCQFRVSEGDKILAPRMDGKIGETVKIPSVLLLNTGDKTIIGRPKIEGAVVEAEVLGPKRGKKVLIYKFIRRENYRRKRGHRQQYTQLKITKIQF